MVPYTSDHLKLFCCDYILSGCV